MESPPSIYSTQPPGSGGGGVSFLSAGGDESQLVMGATDTATSTTMTDVSPTSDPPRKVVKVASAAPEDTHLDVIAELSLKKVYTRTGKRLVRSVLYAFLARLLFGFVKALAGGGLNGGKTLKVLQSEWFSLNSIKWGALIGGLSSYRAVQETLSRLIILPLLLTVMGVSGKRIGNSGPEHHSPSGSPKDLNSSASDLDFEDEVLHSISLRAGLSGQTVEDRREEQRKQKEERRSIYKANSWASALSAIGAGALVALSYRVMNMKTQTELGLYIAVRAMHSLCAATVYSKVVPEKYQKTLSGYLAIVVMCITNTQILYGLVFEPMCHPSGYTAFLRKCTLCDPRSLETVAALHRQVPCPESADYIKNVLKNAVPLLPTKAPFPMSHSCEMIHHGMSCEANLLNFMVKHFSTFSLPLYVPLKLTTTLVFGYSKVFSDPLWSLWKIAVASCRSAAFLTVFCTPATAAMCSANKLGYSNPLIVSLFAALPAGLATYLEPEGRRLDVALYCTMQAFRHATLLCAKRGVINPPTKWHIHTLSAFGLGVLFYLFDHEWTQLHPNIRKALQWLTAEKRSSRVRTHKNLAVDPLELAQKMKRKQMSLVNPPPVTLIDDLENLSSGDYSESLASTVGGAETPRTRDFGIGPGAGFPSSDKNPSSDNVPGPPLAGPEGASPQTSQQRQGSF